MISHKERLPAIDKALVVGTLQDNDAIQEILATSRQQIGDLRALNQLRLDNITQVLFPECIMNKPVSYSAVIPDDTHFSILEYANLDSVIALSRTSTRLWDMLNSQSAAPIWKALAGIYFSGLSVKDTIDSLQKFKEVFVKYYKWRYVHPDDLETRYVHRHELKARDKSGYEYLKIRRKNLLWRTSVESGLTLSLQSKEFKEKFAEKYTKPLALLTRPQPFDDKDFLVTDPEAKGGIPLCSLAISPDIQHEKPVVIQDFLDHFEMKIMLNQDSPSGILYDVQRLYEKTNSNRYKETLDYIFHLALAEDEINLETIIEQFSDGLLDHHDNLRGDKQERALFFYVIYLAMRCYQTQVIDRLLAKGFGVDETVSYNVEECWSLIVPDEYTRDYPRCTKNQHCMNMLDLAIEAQSFKMINYLVSKGVDINATAEPHFTRVRLETDRVLGRYNMPKSMVMLEFLLKQFKADPNKAFNESNIRPLHFVAVHKSYDPEGIRIQCQLVQLLVNHGADVNVRTQQGATPLHHVQHDEVAKVFVDNHADVDAEDNQEATPLYYKIVGTINRAKRREYGDAQELIAIARLLCQKGADVRKLLNGKTLLQMTEDAIPLMSDQKARQKIQESLTVLQTTNPIEKKGRTASLILEEKIPYSGVRPIPSLGMQTTTDNGRNNTSVTVAPTEQKVITESAPRRGSGSGGWMQMFSRIMTPELGKSEKKEKSHNAATP